MIRESENYLTKHNGFFELLLMTACYNFYDRILSFEHGMGYYWIDTLRIGLDCLSWHKNTTDWEILTTFPFHSWEGWSHWSRCHHDWERPSCLVEGHLLHRYVHSFSLVHMHGEQRTLVSFPLLMRALIQSSGFHSHDFT